MVTVSSNINIYSNRSENNRLNNQIEEDLMIKKYSPNEVTAELDKFYNSQSQTPISYINEIKSKFTQNNQINNKQKEELTPEEKKEIENLKKTDQRVRAHEQAHLAAGAGLVRGGASFEYTRGPDGKMYAIGGEVKIDISPVNGKPEETIRKMQKVIATALAPVDPSPQDRAVASMARNIQIKAQMEEIDEIRKNSKNKESSNFTNNTNSIQRNNQETIDNKIEQNKGTISKNKVIKQYIINNPYQNLDRILFKSI